VSDFEQSIKWFKLCWPLGVSVLKKAINDGSTRSFSSPTTQQTGWRESFPHDCLLPGFGTDIPSRQYKSYLEISLNTTMVYFMLFPLAAMSSFEEEQNPSLS
jgi:hypothetical protein